MLSKTFVFNKIQKSPDAIEERLNEWLKGHEFKYATQNESVAKGKFVITVFANKKKSSIRCKVFRNQLLDALDESVNEFLGEHGMKFVTQTFVGSNIYTVLFYDAKSSTDEDDQPTT